MRTGGNKGGRNEPTRTHRETTMSKKITRTKVNRYFENHLTAKNNDYISKHNEKLLKEFYQTIKGNDSVPKTEIDHLTKWKYLLKKYIDSDKEGIQTEKLDELTRVEYSEIIDSIKEDKEKDYADRTIDDYKSSIRMFYNSRYMEFQRPDRVKEILNSDVLKNKREDDKEGKRVKNYLTPQQVRKMSKAAESARDKLLPLYLFDCGARTEEALERTLSDVRKDGKYWEVRFHDCKNGKPDRELPLVHCQEKLRNWIQNHPRRDEPDAPLWVVTTNSGCAQKGSKMSQRNMNDRLKELARRANLDGVDPDTVTVYDMRRSSATFRGTEEGFGIQQMMWWYAWKKPDRAKTYCKDDNDRMKKAIYKRHGIETEEDEKSVSMETKYCPRCEEEQSSDAKFCPTCSLPLDSDTAMKDSALSEAGRTVVEMKLDEKTDDKRIEKLVKEINKERGLS